MKFRDLLKCGLSVIDDQGIIAFLDQIQRDEFCDVLIIIYYKDLLFCSYVKPLVLFELGDRNTGIAFAVFAQPERCDVAGLL